MSQSIQALEKAKDNNKILEHVITKGDLTELSPEQRVSYYNALCQSLKLNPLTKPFDFLEIEDKKRNKTRVVIYANKDCAAQLRDNHQVSIHKLEQETKDGCLIVTAHAKTPDGREDVDQGVVFVKGLVGESLANAIKKTITQAKRRVTLSICGLGFLDESEIGSIPNAWPLSDPEQDAVMTETEAEQLTLSHKTSGLDQWKCGRANAMLVINICKRLEDLGVPEDVWRTWLPEGIQSRKDLTEEEAHEVHVDFTARTNLINTCAELGARGVEKEIMRQRLPGGVQTLKDLTRDQAKEALKTFAYWLKTYQEVVTND